MGRLGEGSVDVRRRLNEGGGRREEGDWGGEGEVGGGVEGVGGEVGWGGSDWGGRVMGWLGRWGLVRLLGRSCVIGLDVEGV